LGGGTIFPKKKRPPGGGGSGRGGVQAPLDKPKKSTGVPPGKGWSWGKEVSFRGGGKPWKDRGRGWIPLAAKVKRGGKEKKRGNFLRKKGGGCEGQ